MAGKFDSYPKDVMRGPEQLKVYLTPTSKKTTASTQQRQKSRAPAV